MREFWLGTLVAVAIGGGSSLPPPSLFGPVSREELLFDPVEPVFGVVDSGDPQPGEGQSPEALLFDDVLGVIPTSFSTR